MQIIPGSTFQLPKHVLLPRQTPDTVFVCKSIKEGQMHLTEILLNGDTWTADYNGAGMDHKAAEELATPFDTGLSLADLYRLTFGEGLPTELS